MKVTWVSKVQGRYEIGLERGTVLAFGYNGVPFLGNFFQVWEEGECVYDEDYLTSERITEYLLVLGVSIDTINYYLGVFHGW